jgi:pyrimidine-specific ribonucleoside hydrolase
MRKLCVCLALLCLVHSAGAERVWIDTDLSIGSPIREVDDAYALVLAFHSPEIQIAGLSTTYGNAPLSQTTRVTLDFVRRFGELAGLGRGDVFVGAKSARALGERTQASDALAASLRKKKLTYIALGPLTNLATFLQLHPGWAGRIERVIFLGGQTPGTTLAFGPTRSFRIHDANVFKDPAAVKIVLESKIPIVLVPVDAASRLQLDRDDLRSLTKSGPAGEYLSQRSRIWLWFWTNFVKTKGGPIFDAAAILPVTRPELLPVKQRSARMDEVKNLIVEPRSTIGARPIHYGTAFAPGTKEFVMRRLMTRPSR